MSRYPRHGIVVTIAFLCLASDALAEAPAPSSQATASDPSPAPTWRVGADLIAPWHAGVSFLGGLGSLGNLGMIGGPEGGLGLEVRVADGWWLLVELSAAYDESHAGTDSTDSASLGGSFGARARLAQLGPVMISAALQTGAQYVWSHQRSESDGVATHADAASLNLATRLGFACDVALTSAIDLRIASEALRFEYASADSGHSTHLGFDLRPSIGLGVRF